MPIIPDTPQMRQRFRRAVARSRTGVVTFGDMMGARATQGPMRPERDAATGMVTLIRSELPAEDPEIMHRRAVHDALIHFGLEIMGHIEDDPVALIPSSLRTDGSAAKAIHHVSARNDRIFADDLSVLLDDLKAADKLLGYPKVRNLLETIAEVRRLTPEID